MALFILDGSDNDYKKDNIKMCPVKIFRTETAVNSMREVFHVYGSEIHTFDKIRRVIESKVASSPSDCTRKEYTSKFPVAPLPNLPAEDLKKLHADIRVQPASSVNLNLRLIFKYGAVNSKNGASIDLVHFIEALEALKSYVQKRTSTQYNSLMWGRSDSTLTAGSWYSVPCNDTHACPWLAQVVRVSGTFKGPDRTDVYVRMLTVMDDGWCRASIGGEFKDVNSVGVKTLTRMTHLKIGSCKCCSPSRECFCIRGVEFCARACVVSNGPAFL